ncbi:glycerophosphoryl diester phosphodiesterase [Halobellus salinus]|uniref:Glycerophosphoryl diester phosphodiesterase n=1 Tax=Halobellus salinus TaxID=931585 RepID=A0A830EJ27_9EURY|nr:glycerophosphodiester phosphodiesterase [Halobellus salinus]GGJ16476.1 glycerophosphoryl diester phosphodiesterase [Halobellus salinus]SMP34020.1 glycerophosphoryl diester phosphodiesterase [Halobellus salinus]
MRPIAHRGCLTQYPENTLAAFRGAAPHVGMIETDVRRCGSGELVIFHDDTLDRVTDATGEVASTPMAVLEDVSILGSEEPIPRLTEVLETVPEDVGLNLELKGRDVATETVAVAAEYDHEVVVSSFYPDDVAAARDAGAETTAHLYYAEEPVDFDVEAAVAAAADLGCAYVHPDVDSCLETDVVEEAHDRGVGVNAWTAETESEVLELRARGVDGAVINDCRFAAVCRSGRRLHELDDEDAGEPQG